MAVEQRRQSRDGSKNSTSPRRDRSRSACWYAKRARAAAGGGRHRDRDAQQHVHAGWLTGKTREGLHIGRIQRRRGSCWVPWDGRRASPRRAAHLACLPACLYPLAELAIPQPGSASTVAAAMRAQPASGSRWRNPAPGSQTTDGEW